jgi:hypothetical protein
MASLPFGAGGSGYNPFDAVAEEAVLTKGTIPNTDSAGVNRLQNMGKFLRALLNTNCNKIHPSTVWAGQRTVLVKLNFLERRLICRNKVSHLEKLLLSVASRRVLQYACRVCEVPCQRWH